MNEENKNQNNDKKPDKKKNSTLLIILAIGLFFFLGFRLFSSLYAGLFSEEVTYSEFLNAVQAGDVREAELHGDSEWYFTKKSDKSKTYYTSVLPGDESYVREILMESGVKITVTPASNFWMIFIAYILPLILLGIMFFFLMKKTGGNSGGVFNFGKSTARKHSEKDTRITFADVAGEEEAKESLREIVDFLHNPKKYTEIGAKLPKGALLVGAPGTGKTLLAKAVAGEAKVPFFSLSGSDFVEMFVGVGASRVRDLFKKAQQEAPCIIFIDEIDAIGKSRDSQFAGTNDEREQTLNQLLAEMDGFDSSKGVIVMGATNRPEILDKALLRPGRFDRRIIVDKPDLIGREAILKVHAKNVKMADDVDLHEIALATPGAVGSDLANMINEAAINAAKQGRAFVLQKDLSEAVETVLVGKEKKDRIMSKEERRIVSYHEVGHALISALQKHSEPVQKITIVPRTMGALGFVMQTPENEKYLNSKSELLEQITGLLGGRAAEEIVFNDITTGAANDIERATALAREMVTTFGMSEEFGPVSLDHTESQYLNNRRVYDCSAETVSKVDEEVKRIIHERYDEAKSILGKHRASLDGIADFLIEKETITGKEFMEILHSLEPEEIPENPVTEKND